MRRTIACSLCALFVVACGSKSQLRIPEYDWDAGMDAGVDAGLDAGTDAGPVPDECIELPFRDPPRELPITFVAQILSADVYFLVDVTGSMGDEIEQIRDGLTSRIIPGLAATIPDVRFSVGRFADFNVPSFGYGSDGDEVFRLVQSSTGDVDTVLAAVNRLNTQSGGDTPESMVEALYLSATGEGLGSWAPAARCPEGTVGYPCWRSTGSPIILAFTDAPSHNGPGGAESYASSAFRGPQPHTYEQTVNALRNVGAKVLGLNSGDFGETGRDHLEALARDTGAVRPDGTPIVFDIRRDGSLLGDAVIEAVRTLVDEVPIDVDVVIEDWPFDEVDASMFVDRVEAVSAMPASGAVRRADHFEDVRPGTRVNFRILLFNDAIPQTDVPQRFFLNVILRADGVTRLQETLLEIIIPPRGGEVICPL
ncbi:MAG: VWA domain-containing protein [Myxococcales bacterium]|nr:VWA domain-containing protein [Myxococcales bacterium]